MPFDIQLKGFIIGALFAYYLLPWMMGKFFALVGSRKTADA